MDLICYSPIVRWELNSSILCFFFSSEFSFSFCLTAFHIFWCVVFSLSSITKYFLISLVLSSLTHELFRTSLIIIETYLWTDMWSVLVHVLCGLEWVWYSINIILSYFGSWFCSALLYLYWLGFFWGCGCLLFLLATESGIEISNYGCGFNSPLIISIFASWNCFDRYMPILDWYVFLMNCPFYRCGRFLFSSRNNLFLMFIVSYFN